MQQEPLKDPLKYGILNIHENRTYLIKKALTKAKGNRNKAAKKLGISVRQLFRILNENKNLKGM